MTSVRRQSCYLTELPDFAHDPRDDDAEADDTLLNGAEMHLDIDSDSSVDYDTDLDENEEVITERWSRVVKMKQEKNIGTGLTSYKEACINLNIVPIRRILEQLPQHNMHLQHVGMNLDQCKALACAFWHNTCLESLDLEDNGLVGEDLVPIINTLVTTVYLTSLNISDNEIQVVGAMALDDVLRENNWLTHLNLSGTKLGDKEIEYIASGLQANSSVKWLDLSHNNISIEGGKKLGTAIGDSRTLQSLNLSWNHIRMAGAVGILKGLQINNSLFNVNLSMNGLGFEGSLALETTLRENTCLKYFDISNNRINWECVSYVAKGLKRNGTLQMLRIGDNPINMEGCYELMKAIACRKCQVTHVGLDNIPVNGAVVNVVNEIIRTRRFSLTHGGLLDTRDVVGIRKEKPEDPISIVVRYLATVGIRIIDLFRMFDSDNDGEVSRREFSRGLKRMGVPLSDRDIASVARRLDKNKKGYINYQLLSHGVRSHVREERKEDKREQVRKRSKLEERRRILQTELPEIYRRNYEYDQFNILTSSTTFLGSPAGSATASTYSMHGGQKYTLPAIDSNRASFVSNHGQPEYAHTLKPTKYRSIENVSNIDSASDNGSKRNSLTARGNLLRRNSITTEGQFARSANILKYIHTYLERKRTQAKVDIPSLIPSIDT